MATACVIPSPTEIRDLGAVILPAKRKDYLLINDILPFLYVDNYSVTLRRPDVIRGMQPARALGAEPEPMEDGFNRYGAGDCVLRPGYYAEQRSLTEVELAHYAEPGHCPTDPLNASAEISRIMTRQFQRALVRAEYTGWQTLLTGRFTAYNQANKAIYSANYNITPFYSIIPFSNLNASRPLAFFGSIGADVFDTQASFQGAGVKYYLNSTTLQVMFQNANGNDLGRGNLSACCNTIDLEWINSQFAARGLGQFVVYDGRYVDAATNVYRFLPDGWVLIVGTRPDAKYPGYTYTTRNPSASNCVMESSQMKGFWTWQQDNCHDSPIRQITVASGWQGLTGIEYPEMVIPAKVF